MKEIQRSRAEVHGLYQVVESFIVSDEHQKLTQLLSVFELQNKSAQQLFARAEFAVKSKAWRLEKIGRRESITSDEYYSLLFGPVPKAVEPKARMVFTLDGMRYSLESNTERNYSVIQVECPGKETVHHKELLGCFETVEVLGELYMSLEETFARLHLEQPPAGSLEDAVTIFTER